MVIEQANEAQWTLETSVKRQGVIVDGSTPADHPSRGVVEALSELFLQRGLESTTSFETPTEIMWCTFAAQIDLAPNPNPLRIQLELSPDPSACADTYLRFDFDNAAITLDIDGLSLLRYARGMSQWGLLPWLPVAEPIPLGETFEESVEEVLRLAHKMLEQIISRPSKNRP